MKIPNLLLIAGTGNKSGKTIFACRVIAQFRDYGIVGIKITPHFHQTTPGLVLISEKEGYSLYEETNSETSKDTSRMLRAGAARVFFAKVSDKTLLDAFMEVYSLIPEGIPIVCESPALRYHVDPGLFIIMTSENASNLKNIKELQRLPHVMIHLDVFLSLDKSPVGFDGEKWILKPANGDRQLATGSK